MNSIQKRVAWCFIGYLALVVLVGIGVDLWLESLQPDGSLTISWSMALWGRDHPGLVFFLGMAVGSVVVGLPIHFWLGQIRPSDWDEMIRLRAAVKIQQAEIDCLMDKTKKIDPQI